MANQLNPVYDFTGTGGCLAAAKRICADMPEFTPVPIAAFAGETSITVDAEAVGFVFPLYFTGLPLLVADFVKKLSFSHPCYIFAIVACGSPKGYALHRLNRLLERHKAQLSAGFYLKMPSNYLPINDLLDEEKISRLTEGSQERLGEILVELKSRAKHIEQEKARLVHAVYPYFAATVNNMDKHFHADEKCNSCGTCKLVCPVNNIELKNGAPVWQHKCQFCLACIHFCPQRAIQWKDITQTRGRYHFKGVSVADIAGQKKPSV